MKLKRLAVLLTLFVIIFSCIKFKELATLTTNNASNITTNSFTCGGNITNGGGADITARGVCWSTSQSPAVSGSHTNDGTGTGSYTSNITGLTPGTKYYIRAYATNNAGTACGNEISCTTLALSAPTLTTVTATEVGLTSAKSGGTISSDGGAPITAKGVCWSTSAHPTIESSKTSDGTGSTAFVSNLSPLISGTTYYYRAYATNSVETAYGNELTFTTTCTAATATTNTATGISATSATLNGTINGNGSSTTVTFEYGTTTGYGSTASATPGTVSGSSNTSVSAVINGLLPNTSYHYRVKAVNCGGTTYGIDMSIIYYCIAPTATTNTATNIGTTSATLNGMINGNASSTIVTFEYGTTTGYGSTASATPGTLTGSSNTAVSAGLTGLTINTPYHYRVKAVNCGGTIYGSDQMFTTTCTASTATTNTATSIGTTSATIDGTVNGNGSSTTVTFEYGLTTGYGSTISATPGNVSESSNTSVSAVLTGLTINALYHYRIKAENCGGTTYGSDHTFATKSVCNQTLVSPLDNAVLDNGCYIYPNARTWVFNWNNCTDATSYELYIIGPNSTSPEVDLETLNTQYTLSDLTRIYESDRIGWTWKVRSQINAVWGAWSVERTFNVEPMNTDCPTDPVTDIEGNIYKTVAIGTQVWMAENLKVTVLNDYTPIPNTTDNSTWANLRTLSFCWYNNDEATYKNVYGALYNWYTVNTGKLCPAGWHVPSDTEWTVLTDYLGGLNIAGGKMKETGNNHWVSPNTGATNESSFTGLGSGIRHSDGVLDHLGYVTQFWSDTESNSSTVWNFGLDNTVPIVYREADYKWMGQSVRCIQN